MELAVISSESAHAEMECVAKRINAPKMQSLGALGLQNQALASLCHSESLSLRADLKMKGTISR